MIGYFESFGNNSELNKLLLQNASQASKDSSLHTSNPNDMMNFTFGTSNNPVPKEMLVNESGGSFGLSSSKVLDKIQEEEYNTPLKILKPKTPIKIVTSTGKEFNEQERRSIKIRPPRISPHKKEETGENKINEKRELLNRGGQTLWSNLKPEKLIVRRKYDD